MKKIIGILFGGKSTEHEISVRSARNVYKNMDKEKYQPYLIFIAKDGSWYKAEESNLFSETYIPDTFNRLSLIMDASGFYLSEFKQKTPIIKPDVIFPVLHGPNGEDGSVQGLLEVAGIAYVGCGIAGSCISMDKEIAKKLLMKANLDVAPYVYLNLYDQNEIKYNEITAKLGTPLVVKPSRAGSSVGISKANNIDELKNAIDYAFTYDSKVLVESYIKGREIEVAVLGNDVLLASTPGEIVTEFYDYKEKYSSESKTRLDVPAKLSKKDAQRICEAAIRAFKALECTGMGRVDFFLTPDTLIVNEINTIPGFTNISMYPKLFEYDGISQQELISRLIDLAIDRFKKNKSLKISYTEE